ncbi:HNH endonuclease signature motif containing protein [Brevibacterium renqingii]|uniref:HNH endonuclease signature motif containing protein n=1 Tax=Brevibacterium renqingii TaxID=2776916 RepID=UPI001AE0492A|nr:HNH endonuclease signature motif containing protein [Brevibacterium renqingii]
MALIPDRRHDEQNDSEADPQPSPLPASPEDQKPTYRELLEAAGFDLTGHPLADRFDGTAEFPVEEDAEEEAGAANSSALQGSDFRGGEGLWSPDPGPPRNEAEVQACIEEIEARQAAWMQEKREEREAQRAIEHEEFLSRNPQRREEIERANAEWDEREARYEESKRRQREAERAAEFERTERHRAVAENRGAAASAHPLLDEYRWSDLNHIAPEVTESIDRLQGLLGELHDFTRPMGPDDAVTVLDGLETLDRLTESLSIVTLSVFERVGTPRDFGAKTTKALVQHRLNLSSHEAYRRTQLAEHLGRRTSMSGESIEAKFPILAAALREGALSSNQATTIIKCLKALPPTAAEDDRIEAERLLVEKAPTVRVRDIHVLFDEILGWIDPDGAPPKEAADREDFNVNLRQMKDGTWTFKGRLDEETGGVLNGLLTSRIKTDEKSKVSEDGAAEALDQTVVDAFTEVLRGDRSDCLDPSLDFSLPQAGDDGEIPQGAGVREDGSLVAMAAEQPSVRRRIYERFSSLIGSIEMNRIKAGAAYALVVTAKAEDLVARTGRAATGDEAPFPITTAALDGLNGSVFFHLMSEKTKSMALATERRLATEKQLAVLASRDQGCTFPGCDTPPGWCEAHHIVPWARGGRTDVNNLTLACSAHHHLIDKSDWFCRMLADGRPAWVPPASIDQAREPILHARFIAREIGETLFG